MSNDKMREEFEVAVLRDWPQAKLHRCAAVSSRAGQYADEIIQHAWWGWQASRAALVIELPELNPEMFSCNVVFGHEKARNEATKAIEAAGVKVKP
jgi:uroporphyrinogen-III synthase